jgi:hypothetical protein
MAKRYTKQSESGEGGIALIGTRVTEMGFIWHPRRVDHGIDGEIELVDRDRRRPLNRTVSVQSKARQRFSGEDSRTFYFVCDSDDVAYWTEANVPVILVCSHPDTGEAWWAPVCEILKDPERQRTRRIDFNKQRDRFDSTAAAGLVDLAAPPSASLYVPTIKMPERLTSNLLQVERVPETIWATPATVAGNREAWEVLHRNGTFAADWMIIDRTLFSFRRTDEEPFSSIIDGKAEEIDTSEWSNSKSPDTCRNFVRLLNQTLGDMTHHELRRHARHGYLYFRPTSDCSPRRLSTGKSKSGRIVCQAYADSNDPEKVRYFRHHALDHHFVRFDGQWFLELNPTYHFTTDGYHDLPWGAEYVKGMKRREKNSAVRGLVDMWAGYFVGTENLFVSRTEMPIRFGSLEAFVVDRGIDERAWKRPSEVASTGLGDTPSLFEAS